MGTFSRRKLFGTAAAAVAAEAGTQLLLSPFFPQSGVANVIRKAILDGDGRALAESIFTVPTQPIFILSIHAKWESAGWLSRPNANAVGLAGTPLVAQSSAYPMHGFTRQFGDYLLPLQNKIAFGIVPATTTAGNHTYDGLKATMKETGCLSDFVNQKNGSLLSLYFSSTGQANGSTACFGSGGNQLITYTTVDSAVASAVNALGPLQNLTPSAQKVLAQLNDRVTKDESLKKGLEDLAGRLASARPGLNSALAVSKVKPSALPAAGTILGEDVLMTNNPLISQFQASVAVIDAGLAHSVVLSIANSDPNSGGNHAVAEGSTNTSFGPRSPNEVKSCVAQVIVKIFEKYPGAIVSIVTDGGRSSEGGDSQNAEFWIAGPPATIKNVFLNASTRANSSGFGTDSPAVMLSNGKTAVPTEANVMATVAKAAGIVLPNYPYIPGLLTAA